VLIALQKANNASILKCTIVVGEGSFRLTILLVFPSPYFVYASCDWWGLWNMICSYAPL
jgi:hypothetical protein